MVGRHREYLSSFEIALSLPRPKMDSDSDENLFLIMLQGTMAGRCPWIY